MLGRLGRPCSFARCLSRVLGGLHHLVIWKPRVIYWLGRAGAEQEGEDEEGHYGRSELSTNGTRTA